MKKVITAIGFYFLLVSVSNDGAAQENKLYKVRVDSIIVEAQRDRPIPKFSTVATKLDVELQKVPMSVGVINQALIHNQDNANLGETLQNLSGVNKQSGNGVHDYFIIRGLNSLENSLILTDGTPEPEVTYYNLYNVERVELLKGPGAFLYGSNPLSGTVNIVRKQPLFRKFLKASTVAGQFSTTRSMIEAGVGNVKLGLASRINMLYEKSDNYRENKGSEVLAVNPSVTWSLNNSTALNVNLEYIVSQYAPDSGIPLIYDPMVLQLKRIPEIPKTTSFQTPFDYSDQKIARLKIRLDKKVNSLLSLQSKFYATRLDWKSRGTLLNGAFPTPQGSLSVNRSISDLDDVRNMVGMQFEATLALNTGRLAHQILAGVEWNVLQEDYRYDVAPFIADISLNNPVETVTENQIYWFPYLQGDVTNQVVAPYVLDRLSITDQIQVTGGFRYDMIQFENRAAGYLTDRSFSHLSPFAGLNVSLIPALTLYVSHGSAFAPPSSQVVGVQEAERGRQVEFGIKQRYFEGRLNLDLAWYRLEKDNIAIPALDGIRRQLGDLVSQGVEVELAAEPLKRWFAFVSYSYSDVELTRFHERVTVGTDAQGLPIEYIFDRTGNAPAFTPAHLLNFWSTKAFENGLGIGFGLRYVGKQFIDEDNIFQIEEALILSAKVNYQFRNWRFGVHVKNLTNEKTYYRGFGASSVIPANPRAIFIQLDVTLP